MVAVNGVALIGAGGFLGKAVQRRIADIAKLPLFVALEKEKFDLSNPITWTNKLDGCDCVIIAAARIDGPTFDIFQTNTLYLREFVSFLHQTNIRKVINISTGAVYGPSQHPTNEATPCNPIGAYPTSKFLGERILAENFKGITNNLRLYYPYGAHQKPPRFLPNLTAKILRGELVHFDPLGHPLLTMTHVDDIAEVIFRDFVFKDDKDRSHVNLASGSVHSVKEISQEIANLLNVELHAEEISDAVNVISESYKNFNWQPFRLSHELLRTFSLY